uniref:EB domain-containing protein n=1 Tax=Romanomermis culicivorax TaxID=13658 RepID=A0A915HX25_ROMCU
MLFWTLPIFSVALLCQFLRFGAAIDMAAECVDDAAAETPGLYQRCKDLCQRPTSCQPFDANGKTVNVCQCSTPYFQKDGQCTLDCKDNEYYDSSTFKCIPKCKYAEVLIGQTCLPINGLSSSCVDQKQCNNAFSQCKSGLCTCLDGFEAKSSKCVPMVCRVTRKFAEVNCPNGGSTLKNGDILQMCVVTVDKNNQHKDSCPD